MLLKLLIIIDEYQILSEIKKKTLKQQIIKSEKLLKIVGTKRRSKTKEPLLDPFYIPFKILFAPLLRC